MPATTGFRFKIDHLPSQLRIHRLLVRELVTIGWVKASQYRYPVIPVKSETGDVGCGSNPATRGCFKSGRAQVRTPRLWGWPNILERG